MGENAFIVQLNDFIVKAKLTTYVGSGVQIPGCRLESHDLEFNLGDFQYRDSYFGGQDFLGEEIVWYQNLPVWGENYYGKILRPELYTGAEAGQMIKRSLTQMYQEGRFLGGFRYEWENILYTDQSSGGIESFHGIEEIYLKGLVVYRLYYHGGLIH